MDTKLKSVSIFVLLSLAVASSFIPQASASTVPVQLYGPEQFIRDPGSPQTVSRDFSVQRLVAQSYTLQVQNGSMEGDSQVSSAVVELNGSVILKQNDFNQNVYYLEEPVAVQAANTLEVKLNSMPTSYIIVTVVGNYLPVDVDDDGDGFTENEGDCNDADSFINPSAVEVCDYVDNDCDGQIDEGVQQTFFLDADADTYGLSTSPIQDCSVPSGYAEQNGDCDDTAATINPAATEVCNAIDDNCDGQVDEGFDLDSDGYTVCAGDCDDNDQFIFPGAVEVCLDLADNNCDGQVDEGCLINYYMDADGDGYGDPGTTIDSPDPTPPAGYVTDSSDCDDTDASVNPAAQELCWDGADNNCDGAIDPPICYTYYCYDSDSDGYGDPGTSSLKQYYSGPFNLYPGFVLDCSDCNDNQPLINPGATEVFDTFDNNCDGSVDEGFDLDGDGYAVTTGDCDDNNASINPAAVEICDDIDNNCNNQVDEGLPTTIYYLDSDGDGYGRTYSTYETCGAPPAGYVSVPGDCVDYDPAINPGAVEICDSVDNNCDGINNEGIPVITYYYDGDGDGYGRPSLTQETCGTPPANYVLLDGDCHDYNPYINPGATEVCDYDDNNCDGTINEGFDLDADGYTVCGGDCNDAVASINPGATEICDGIDNDCDNNVDENVLIMYRPDADGDGWAGDSGYIIACTAPSGYVESSWADDCDDTNASVNPAALEICDGIDNNCNYAIDEGFDIDGDGYTTCAGDCDDTDVSLNPGVAEICDDIDNNCDGTVDEGLILTFYADADADGYGVSTDTIQACAAPSGYVAISGDCDEADPAINPGASEICDGVDNNCDGITDPVCLTGIIADPVSFYLSGAGAVRQLLVTGYYSDGSSADLTSSSTGTIYTSGDQNVVTVNVNGLVTSVGLGSTTVTAANTGQSSNVNVTVWSLPANYQPQPEGSFGSIYEDLVPPDVTLDSFDPQRFSLITGLVQMRGGLPLADVTVTIHGHPEYGSVVTDASGRFTIPVDGEATMTVAYAKTGLLEVHRKVFVPWNDMAVVETITMIPEDIVSTQVAFDGNPATVYTHRSTETSDTFGQRAFTAVITGDNRAYYIDSIGTQVFLPTITVRATEYNTPETMPAKLPPTSAFTYCAELSVDGVSDIQFEQPVVTFVENFLGFDVGTPVPIGYYDRSLGEWIPELDGVVVRLLDTDSDGVVDALDADGDSIQDDLNSNGLFSDEVTGLQDSTIYLPQSTYWMVKLTHFTPWDWNWPFGLPGDAFPPSFDAEPSVDSRNDGSLGCGTSASFVEHRSRVFHEDIPVPGTGLTLHYSSGRVEGYKSIITVPASGATVPASLKRIEVELKVAGKVFKQVLNAAPNQKAEFAWDGKDFNGRSMFGRVPATTRIDYIYDGVYRVAGGFERTFAQLGGAPTAIPTREIVSSSRTQQLTIRRNELSPIADGWTLSNNHYHYLDLNGQSVVFKGDGTRQLSAGNIFTIDTIAGNGNTITAGAGIEAHPDGTATDIAISPKSSLGTSTNERILADGEGNIYFIESYSDPNAHPSGAGLVRKVDKEGVLSTIAGGGNSRSDNILATNFRFNWISDIAIDREGNLYVAEWYGGIIYKVDKAGIVTRYAGLGYCAGGICRDGDNGPATDAHIAQIVSMTIDPFGDIYLIDEINVFKTLRKIDANGIITTLEDVGFPGEDLISDQFGNIFYYETPDAYGHYGIVKLEPSGKKYFIAGNGQLPGDDGVKALGAYIDPTTLTVDSLGNIYFVDGRSRARKVDQSGVLSTVAGTINQGFGGDTGPATEAIMIPDGITLDVAGNLYASGNNRIRKIYITNTTGMDAYLAEGEAGFAEEGNIGYVFSPLGYHRRTIDLSTGQTLTTFGYDTQDRLVSIRDRFGNETTIQRDAGGVPVSITSPDGIVTSFTVDADNNLRQVAYPDGTYYAMDYLPGGLMSDEYLPDGSRFTHVFDPYGRLTDAQDPEGGHWTYDRQADASGNVNISVLTGEGDSTTYVDRTNSIGEFSSVITGPDGSQTIFNRSSDGLSARKQTACGTELTFNYGLDSEYSYQELKSSTTTMPSGISVATSTDRVYIDSDLDGSPDRITDTVTTNGKVSTVVNDTIAGTVTATSPTGRTVMSYYDPVSLLTSRTSTPGLLDTDFVYDARGRLTDVTVGTRTTSFAYDTNGYLDFMTTPDNRTFEYAYDVMGRLTGEVRPDGASVSYSYDNNGNMTVLVNPNLVSHSFSYTANDQRKSYTTPISGGYSYLYDKDRRLSSVTYPSGQGIGNFYLDGNLDSTVTPEGTISYSYDCGGKLGSVTKGSESTSYTYDGSLLLSDTRLGTVSEVIDYTYDTDMRVGSIGYASGVESFLYDNDGLLTNAGTFTITRNASNGLPEAVSDGTVVQGRVFSGYGEVDSIDYTVGAAAPYNWSVTRDNAGRITQKVENIGVDTVTWDYTYDLMGRLETVYKDSLLAEAYSYDDNGNRLSENNVLSGVSRSYTHSVEDHTLTAGADSYVFDVDGFLTTRTLGGNTDTFDYSSRGELLSVSLASGNVITYDHDPLGRRVAKRVNGTVVEKYLWQDATTLLAVYNSADTLIQRFSYADGRMPVSMTYQGAVYYLTYDQVGSLRAVTDTTGAIIKRVDYDSFGNILSDSNPTFTVPFGFAGGLHDRDTGLVRFGARDYDPAIGKWTAKDPIDFAGGDLNLYGYVLGDPVNGVDSDGLWSLTYDAGFHLPTGPWPVSAGGTETSILENPFSPTGKLSGEGFTPEVNAGAWFDFGVSAGIADLSGTGKQSGVVISLGSGRYGGVQLTLRREFDPNRKWYNPLKYIDAVTVGLGWGLGLPVNVTVPLDQIKEDVSTSVSSSLCFN